MSTRNTGRKREPKPPPSDSEALVDLYLMLDRNRRYGRITDASGLREKDIARCELAIEMGRRGYGFLFRALFERWSMKEINREMY